LFLINERVKIIIYYQRGRVKEAEFRQRKKKPIHNKKNIRQFSTKPY